MDEALDATRTGDLWLFRGRKIADRAIQVSTNSPVNHVGMAVVIDDLPPLMWHAELGRSLEDLWSGAHQRRASRVVDGKGVPSRRAMVSSTCLLYTSPKPTRLGMISYAVFCLKKKN